MVLAFSSLVAFLGCSKTNWPGEVIDFHECTEVMTSKICFWPNRLDLNVVYLLFLLCRCRSFLLRRDLPKAPPQTSFLTSSLSFSFVLITKKRYYEALQNRVPETCRV